MIVDRDRNLSYVLLIASAAGVLWIPPLQSSLWLDELDTYFSTRDGVLAAISRTAFVHPQCSQLYNAFMAAWVSAFGSTEVAMRLPSIVSMGLATYLVYRLGQLLFDRKVGVLAALVFVTMRDVIFSATDARSYAMATAAAVGATQAWLRFLAPPSLYPDASTQGGELRNGSIYAVAAALTVYFHQLYGLVLVVHAGFGLWMLVRRDARVTWAQALGVLIGAALLASGEVPNLLATFTARDRMVHAGTPPLEYLAYLWAAPMVIVAVLPAALAVASRHFGVSYRAPAAALPAWMLLAAWAIVPPLVLFVVSRTTDTHVFLPRYYLSCQPAIAILLGAMLRGFEPARLRLFAAASVAAVAVLLHARPHHGLEDWRGVAATVNASVTDDTPVLVDAGFVEASSPKWLALEEGDERRRFLLAPLEYYPLRGKILLLPYRLNDDTRAYVEGEILPEVLASERFVAVGRGRRPRWWRGWLEGRLAQDGYVATELHDGIYLEATSFKKDAAAAPATDPR